MKIVTITGIRPDFIRMSKVFEKLDERFEHIMVHTGQHYDDELSAVFFNELKIRKPDFVLETGRNSANHYEQLSYLAREVIALLTKKQIEPALVLFLGDSNSALVSAPMFKEGYRIGHIEGGMRSYDRRMPEEVNRVVCDYVSDFVFVYTPLYKKRLMQENKPAKNIFIVGNTIVEVVKPFIPKEPKKGNYLVADIHRSENLKTPQQLNHILDYLNKTGERMEMPVQLVRFRRAERMINEFNLLKDKPSIQLVGPYGFVEYLRLQYHAAGVISDSGTSQEECPLLGVPVAVPRNYTERPESVENGNSILVGESNPVETMVKKTIRFFKNYSVSHSKLRWLGDGKASNKIINILQKELSS